MLEASIQMISTQGMCNKMDWETNILQQRGTTPLIAKRVEAPTTTLVALKAKVIQQATRIAELKLKIGIFEGK